eukprot:357270-Chlamydomonas_euryale.AAC.23
MHVTYPTQHPPCCCKVAFSYFMLHAVRTNTLGSTVRVCLGDAVRLGDLPAFHPPRFASNCASIPVHALGSGVYGQCGAGMPTDMRHADVACELGQTSSLQVWASRASAFTPSQPGNVPGLCQGRVTQLG